MTTGDSSQLQRWYSLPDLPVQISPGPLQRGGCEWRRCQWEFGVPSIVIALNLEILFFQLPALSLGEFIDQLFPSKTGWPRQVSYEKSHCDLFFFLAQSPKHMIHFKPEERKDGDIAVRKAKANPYYYPEPGQKSNYESDSELRTKESVLSSRVIYLSDDCCLLQSDKGLG